MAETLEQTYIHQLTQFLDPQGAKDGIADIILVCGEKEFPANTMILSAASNYFRTIFSPKGKESKSARIELPSVSAKEMDFILHFLYTGKFKNFFDQRLVESLLVTSYSLQITALFECCYKKISESLSCHEFLDICNLAFHYNDEGMISHVLSFLASNFEDIAKSKEFLKLDVAQMQKICQHPDIVKSSIDVAIDRLFRWSKGDKARERVLVEILSTLDRQCMSPVFLSENLCERALAQKRDTIFNMLVADASPRTFPSKNPENINKPKQLMVFGRIKHRQVYRMYDLKENQWSLPKTLPFNLDKGASTAGFGGQLFVFGGGRLTNIRLSDKIIKYSPSTSTVASCGGLVIPVLCAGSGFLGEYIYIVNGINANSVSISTVQRYNPIAHTCLMMAKTNTPHNMPHVFPFEKHLLVLGSFEGQNNVERYDPKLNTWTVITTVSWDTAWSSVAICMKKLFLVPKRLLCEFHIYDFLSDTWEQKQFEGSPSWIFSIFSFTEEGKCILLVRDCDGVLHFFDPQSQSCQWERKSKFKYEQWLHRQACLI